METQYRVGQLREKPYKSGWNNDKMYLPNQISYIFTLAHCVLHYLLVIGTCPCADGSLTIRDPTSANGAPVKNHTKTSHPHAGSLLRRLIPEVGHECRCFY